MELTFDCQDFNKTLQKLGLTIDDVYFGALASSAEHIFVYMYWIAPANQFNYYQDLPDLLDVYVQVKGKWFNTEELHNDDLISTEILDWIKRQAYIRCRYFIDGTGTGTIGSSKYEDIN